MRDFEWQYYEDYPDDCIDNNISYTDYMIDNEQCEEEYKETQGLDS